MKAITSFPSTVTFLLLRNKRAMRETRRTREEKNDRNDGYKISVERGERV